MAVIKKILLVIGMMAAVAIILFVVLAIWVDYAVEKKDNQLPPIAVSSTFELALADPHLLYASAFSAGMCRSEITNEEGGCHSETYLYDSGRYVATGYWEGLGHKHIDQPRVEKELGKTVVDKIIKIIQTSGIMNKECPEYLTVDASWDYQVQIGGQKKSFVNRPAQCQPTLDEISKILTAAAKAK